MKKIAIPAITIVLLAGCRPFDPYPSNYPLIADDIKFDDASAPQALTFAVTAERRFVMLFPDGKSGMKICAEPSPDVALSTTALDQLSAALQTGDLEGIEGASAAVNTLSFYATASMLLTQRSQGLQIYRDGMYYYCQMYIQGIITKEEYLKKEDLLRIAAEKLIIEQVKYLPQLTQQLAAPLTPQPQAASVPPQPLVPEQKPSTEVK